MPVLRPSPVAVNFRNGEKTGEKTADLLAGGETMADLAANVGIMQA